MVVYVAVALAVLALAQGVCVWRVLEAARSVPRLEERMSRLAHSIELLTGATETCFNTLALQLAERPVVAPPVVRRDTRQRRVAGAARRGRTVSQIAAEEQLSESEVALHLHLAKAAPPKEAATPKEGRTPRAHLRS